MRVVSPFSEEGARQIATQGDEAGKIAYVDMEIPGDEWEDAGAIGRTLEEILPSADGLQIELGGAALGEFEEPSSEIPGRPEARRGGTEGVRTCRSRGWPDH